MIVICCFAGMFLNSYVSGFLYNVIWAGIVQSIYQVMGIELFTCPDRPRGPPSHLCNGYQGFFLWVNWLVYDNNQSLPSSTEVEEKVELYFYSTSVPSWPFVG